ncbi:putative succinate-semialdehyde dehydrogenase [Clavispora lusitaniae]|uniref:Succinate-semialdehyde dehydrogenase n=2 Tax=Clavispora lusitaniae TaxID=36911 RepID=C4XVX2_CLAL4|nr:uncharacterized protein CLUG_00095 [Clavispora lusitaniae ATCC 42720]KAF5213477.1 hypothetical protein E0198_000999 [Clavispora lusitaniae]EEQ35972.1 hypothetical protein CLUG_00095 [Clavispora lusitaniae ATCC 42720]QFZ25023.1 putative succinate-semialdehyde dehydrogenase [Clavispora lusitaniae]QFZ31674.1 putative succinate-semialdehyde dehydrogenase [Clavispora lusitaniae]QFZ37342.1 putative succinate-semialdehyde dehydrogenase [Clavispora lusitaniae]
MSTVSRRYSTRVASSLKNSSLFKTQGYVNGEWIKSNASFDVYDPGLYPKADSKIARVSCYSKADYDHAIEAADTAFRTFRKTTGRERSQMLLNMYHLMKENQEDLAKLIVFENGKPYADAYGEITYAASFFQWFSEEAPHICGDIISSANAANRILSFRQPIGVCGIITPWNFPSAMVTRKLAAAIAVGCTAVVKPASETPLSALALAQLADDAGFPKGVINVLPSSRAAEAGLAICENPIVKKVSFTGSTNVGKILMGQAASTMKKCSFELGGNAPFIVFEDTNIDQAVSGVVASKFRSSGQTCICANRIFVHERIYDEFSERLVAKMADESVLGYGLSEETTHGPVIHERSLEKVKDHVSDALSKGASLLLGGQPRPELGDYYHDLTILGDVTREMKIFHEETFGPVCPLIKFSTDEEVLELANDTEVGLAGYFYTNDVSRVFRVAEELNVGMIGVNTGGISEAALPFGGVKESGYGREGSKYGIDDYSVVKSMVLGSIH